MKTSKKWKMWLSHLSARSARPFINVTFWAPFFDQNRKNAIFQFLGAKKRTPAHFPPLEHFLRRNRPKTEKWAQKWKKRICAFRAPKTCPDAYVLKGLALRAKNVIFRFSCIFAIFRFLGEKQIPAPKSGKIAPEPQNPLVFAFFCENGSQNDKKKHCLQQGFGPMPFFFAFWSEKDVKMRFGAKSAHFRSFPHFPLQIMGNALLGRKPERSIAFWSRNH